MKKLSTQAAFIILLLSISFEGSAFETSILVNPPENDFIADAINLNLGPVPFTQVDVNFPEATFTGDGGESGCNVVSAGIWYKFTATADGSVSAFIQTPDNPIAIFYSSPSDDVNSGASLTHIDQPTNPCSQNNFATIETTAGTIYYIYLRNLVVSTIAINVTDAFSAPSNDLIMNAHELDANEAYQVDGDVHFLMATNVVDGGQEGCDTDIIKGVWYKIYTENTTELNAFVNSDPAVSALVFYSSPSGSALFGSELDFVDQPENICGLSNEATIITNPDSWYYIFVATIEPYANVTLNSSLLGVTDQSLVNFNYYPNPVTDVLNLSASQNIDSVEIFNVSGQLVYREEIQMTEKSIDLSYLQNGLYVLYLTADKVTSNYKLIKK